MATRDVLAAKIPRVTRARAVTGPSTAPERIRLCIVGVDDDWADRLRAALPRRLDLEMTVLPSLSARGAGSASESEWDVALAFLSANSMHALTEVLTLHDRLGQPEIVTVSVYENDAVAVALREFGAARVLSQDAVGAWLARYLRPLASMAMAKRLLRRSRAALGESMPAARDTPDVLPLSVAEGRFREAYLRALMAREGSRVQAAEQARIPYRTLCYMLDRFDIR